MLHFSRVDLMNIGWPKLKIISIHFLNVLKLHQEKFIGHEYKIFSSVFKQRRARKTQYFVLITNIKMIILYELNNNSVNFLENKNQSLALMVFITIMRKIKTSFIAYTCCDWNGMSCGISTTWSATQRWINCFYFYPRIKNIIFVLD